jgi:hypothetical protein
MTNGSRLLRGGGSRRRLLALIAYYAVVIVVVGPMCLAQAGADPGARVPVRIALNVALHTKKTNVATFTTPFPITVGVASDGSFTVPRGDLAFALVDVPIATPTPEALGWFTVRAVATSDFLGTVNSTTGVATLNGSLELLWSTRAPAPAPGPSPAQQPMLQCPVGPFALHLSTATLGGALLSPQSLRDPASRTARLVDDNLDVPAVPGGMKQCAGNQGSLNLALSLPILPTPVSTTTTLAATSTTSTTDTTTTTTAPPTTAATSTPRKTIGAPPPGLPTDSLGVALDPKVIALEPSPSIVSTLTIAAVPPPVGSPTTAGTPGLFVAPAPATPIIAGAPPNPTSPASPRTVESAKETRARHRTNRHAQTDAATRAGAATNVTPPLYFSPMNFAPRIAPHNSLLAPGPLLDLGESAFARHHTGLSILFVVFLVIPLAAFGLGLVASDFGWRPRRLGRHGHETKTTRKLVP